MKEVHKKQRISIRTITICSLFAALTAVGAFIRIPLPIIPLTLQFFFMALAGILLGAKTGALSQLIYVLVGLAGIPVFTKGGGLQYILEPTFGYLIGFIVGAYVIGKCVEQFKTINFKHLLSASLIGLLVVYVFGVTYMYFIYNFYLGAELGIWAAIVSGAIACAPGDIVSCVITAVVGMRMIPILRNNSLLGI